MKIPKGGKFTTKPKPVMYGGVADGRITVSVRYGTHGGNGAGVPTLYGGNGGSGRNGPYVRQHLDGEL